VERIAEFAGVSPATVTRFATQMGFTGFPDLQESVRRGVRDRLAPPRRLEHQPHGDIFARSFEGDLQALQQARTANSQEALEAAVRLILGARRTYVAGMRSSYSLAVHIAAVLHQALGSSSLITGAGGFLAEEVLPMDPGDLLFALSFPRYARSVVEIIRCAREKGATILLLTDSARSPASALADVVLQSPFESSSFFNANTAALAVANAVLSGVVASRREETTAHLKAVEESVKRFRGLLE
jgi:DNA-binding MurR/RpiR family transcriptional regulator